MNIFDNYLQLIIEGVIGFLVLYLIYRINTRKPQLAYYITNMAQFTIAGKTPTMIGTHTIMIQNSSGVKAEEIEICHTSAPKYFNVYPDIPWTSEETEQGGQIIKFKDLPAKNKITISYLYFITPNFPSYLPQYVRSKDRYIRQMQSIPTPVYAMWVKVVSYILAFLGFVFLLNLLYELIKIIFKF